MDEDSKSRYASFHIASDAISTNAKTPPKADRGKSRTRIIFDLRDELSEAEIEQFERSAEAAGAQDLTEHFLNLALRKQQGAA